MSNLIHWGRSFLACKSQKTPSPSALFHFYRMFRAHFLTTITSDTFFIIIYRWLFLAFLKVHCLAGYRTVGHADSAFYAFFFFDDRTPDQPVIKSEYLLKNVFFLPVRSTSNLGLPYFFCISSMVIFLLITVSLPASLARFF